MMALAISSVRVLMDFPGYVQMKAEFRCAERRVGVPRHPSATTILSVFCDMSFSTGAIVQLGPAASNGRSAARAGQGATRVCKRLCRSIRLARNGSLRHTRRNGTARHHSAGFQHTLPCPGVALQCGVEAMPEALLGCRIERRGVIAFEGGGKLDPL